MYLLSKYMSKKLKNMNMNWTTSQDIAIFNPYQAWNSESTKDQS